MHQPINQVRLRGFLVGAAHLFVSRSGQARVAFRLEVWHETPLDHPKIPAGVDYFSVITFGEHKTLLPHLNDGREVFVSGYLQSRDVDRDGRKRAVTEIIAREIVLLKTRTGALRDRSARRL